MQGPRPAPPRFHFFAPRLVPLQAGAVTVPAHGTELADACTAENGSLSPAGMDPLTRWSPSLSPPGEQGLGHASVTQRLAGGLGEGMNDGWTGPRP